MGHTPDRKFKMHRSMRTTKKIDLRIQAFRELHLIEEHGAYAGLSRRHATADLRLERRLTDLVSGVTRHRRWLDFLIDSFYTSQNRSLDKDVRIILRLGIYELLHTQTPRHAAIFECVKTGKRLLGPRPAGLINGLLRTVDRNRDTLPVPDSGNQLTDLATRFSHPDWMVRRWLSRYGQEDTEKFLSYNNQRPVFGIRLRSDDTEHTIQTMIQLGIELTKSPYFDDFVRVGNMQALLNTGLLEKKKFLVQDEGAGGVVAVLDPQPGERILDLCAAPGAKSISIADRVGTGGLVTAVDLSESRMDMLVQEARRLGLKQIRTRVADVRAFSEPEGNAGYDRVLLDAPCSGLGVLAKRADLRWRKKEETVAELACVQIELLRSACRHVRPGGVLVYSTCTTEPEENEGIADSFIKHHPEFQKETPTELIPGQLITEQGAYQSLPFRDHIDGAYAVRFRKLPIV